MNAIGVIPARFFSTRFEGKVLANLLGKPMIQHVWENAKKANLLDELVIACDDERIEKKAREFGADVILTSKDHLSGTDRLTEIVQPLDVNVVVNIQADEPLLHFSMIDDMVRLLLDDPSIIMATVIKRIENRGEISDPNMVKVVIDRDDFALYFSRSPIPYLNVDCQEVTCYKHIGLYAYSKDFLFTFRNLPESKLEKMEKLEQLRVLEAGFKIKTVQTKFETIGVDTPQDLQKVEEKIRGF
ncbi:MAG: 3-deoxy-manno-octulosonate cytidylyltransferase [Candidatus Omnitrophica bacterium]|nr:3-deoxy-manno-octulosonate cytidylyltransferase [Candidatus Omnitrophota bacterium]